MPQSVRYIHGMLTAATLNHQQWAQIPLQRPEHKNLVMALQECCIVWWMMLLANALASRCKDPMELC